MKVIEGIYLLLGSNLGDRSHNLCLAREHIEQQAGGIVRHSSIYETEAWGVLDQPLFYNQVLQIETQLGHEALLNTLLFIEKKIGKIKVGKWRERLIDIDLLYYGNRIVRTFTLTLPHPEIQNRRFTLAPLVELTPNELHPVLHQSHRKLLEITPDKLEVWVAENRKPETGDRN
ncbi:MAG: 2-amino-4-hydroxy-6-hydroxymethyldihydropteridine diphosphokinase [Tunicatimonas sp.]|uniref:2-amino-4-hydroxy-6- hydroxymethyldihydropteridine diphosphokinase n=1 Tax=Tunicatimonas sp. TaxID=1940096 RepID=UPI003C71E7D0